MWERVNRYPTSHRHPQDKYHQWMNFDDEHEKTMSAFPCLTFDEEAAQIYYQNQQLDGLYIAKNISV